MRLNIAIDGPVSAGKSSVSDAVAKRLGILHLDTGAMYRALGLAALEAGIDPGDEEAIIALCRKLKVSVSHEADGQHTFVEGRDVTGMIRSPDAEHILPSPLERAAAQAVADAVAEEARRTGVARF